MDPISMSEGWKGYLSFSFVEQQGKTVVKDKKHFGPLVVQKPYYQEINRPTVLVIHPPGGVAGGDELTIDITFLKCAKGMVSTPAATKFYRSQGLLAKQHQTIHVTEHAEVEWLPQETLFFNQSNVENRLVIDMESPRNKLIAWDIVGLGRPARGEGFESGCLNQSLEFWVDGELVFLDRLQLTPESNLINSAVGLNKYLLYATSLFYFEDEGSQQKLLQQLQSLESELSFGVTRINNLIVLRVVANEMDALKNLLFKAWQIARPIILNMPVIKPRIWNT